MHLTRLFPTRCAKSAAILLSLLPPIAMADTPSTAPATRPLRATITPGPDTTIFTAPLRPDGTIDYCAAINQKFSHGVTPENNAYVPLLQAGGTGKAVLGTPHAQIVALADTTESDGCFIPPPPEFAADIADIMRPDEPWVYPKFSWLYHPWKAADHVDMSKWFDANQPYLEVIRRAASRDHFWMPLVPYQENGTLMQATLPAVNRLFRRPIAMLRSRAMRSLGDSNLDAAWEDLSSAHHLSALVAQSPELLIVLVGNGEQWATLQDDVELLRADPSRVLLQKMRAELQAIPMLSSPNQILQKKTRFEGLDAIQSIARAWNDQIEKGLPSNKEQQLLGALDMAHLPAGLDCDRMMRDYNAYWNQFAPEEGHRTPKERAEVDHVVEKMHDECGMFIPAPGTLSGNRFDPSPLPGESRDAYADRLTKALFSIMAPTLGRQQEMIEETEMRKTITLTAIALELYRLDNNTCPADLTALAPRYVSSVPNDFHDRPLLYEHTATSFRLASTGPEYNDLPTAVSKRRAIIVELHH